MDSTRECCYYIYKDIGGQHHSFKCDKEANWVALYAGEKVIGPYCDEHIKNIDERANTFTINEAMDTIQFILMDCITRIDPKYDRGEIVFVVSVDDVEYAKKKLVDLQDFNIELKYGWTY